MDNQKLQEEFNDLLLIEPYITYIIEKNCKDNTFGYLKCAKYLLNIFKSLIISKFNLLHNTVNKDSHNNSIKQFDSKFKKFRTYFNELIYIENTEFDDEINELNKSMR